jgi:hypothetical protein
MGLNVAVVADDDVLFDNDKGIYAYPLAKLGAGVDRC